MTGGEGPPGGQGPTDGPGQRTFPHAAQGEIPGRAPCLGHRAGHAPVEVRTPVIPSKILSIIAAGRPVVAAMNLDGDGPRLIAEARCGLCVPPEDPRALAEAVLNDASLREELGRNGRRYAEEHLSLDRCVAQYQALLQQV